LAGITGHAGGQMIRRVSPLEPLWLRTRVLASRFGRRAAVAPLRSCSQAVSSIHGMRCGQAHHHWS
jgi:hypothetical protein